LRTVANDVVAVGSGFVLGGADWNYLRPITSFLPHELGHFAASELVYQHPNAGISHLGYGGAETHFTTGPLTSFGSHLGATGSHALVAAAGPLVDVGLSALLFGVGYKIRQRNPIVGGLMMGHACYTMYNDFYYALSAVGHVAQLARTGNDFAAIGALAHFPPILAAAAIALVLPVELYYLWKSDHPAGRYA
jgi:hypothetical protein